MIVSKAAVSSVQGVQGLKTDPDAARQVRREGGGIGGLWVSHGDGEREEGCCDVM